MKLIGLLGGTSWPSTPLYYNTLNRMVQARLGGFHSARLVLYSIDYDPVKSLYHHSWNEIPALLEHELAFLYALKPDCVLLCNNTLHKAYDIVSTRLPAAMPFFHVVTLAIAHARAHNFRTVLFLGTRFTMEDDFFTGPLRAAGLEVMVPDAAERQQIQEVQSALASGVADPAHKAFFRGLIGRYPRCEAVVLACTELPLAIDATVTEKPLIDTIDLQCRAAVDFALAD